MTENAANFYWEDENGNQTPLERMTREQCQIVIRSMAEELAYWRRLDEVVKTALALTEAAEDSAEATLQ